MLNAARFTLMRPLQPLPEELVSRPLRRAEALAGGLREAELAGPLWRSPYRDVHVWAGLDPEEPRQRIREAAALLPPGGAVTGWAGANLRGVAVLDGRDKLLMPMPILLSVPPPLRLTRRADIPVLRSRLDEADIGEVEGVPTASLVRSAFDGMRTTALEEAVVIADATLRGGLRRAELLRYVAARPGWRGVPVARASLEVADARAESPNESRLRVVWYGAGLPRPHVNVRVYDDDGNFLGRPDLLDEEAAVAVEFDGAEHRKLARQTSDNVREEGFEGSGLTVVKATAVDLLFERARLQRRLIDARSRGLGRDRRRDRWTLDPLPWWVAAGF